MHQRKITSCGTVTVPPIVLSALNIKAGDYVFMGAQDGVAFFTSSQALLEETFNKLHGIQASPLPSLDVPNYLPPRVWMSRVVKARPGGLIHLPNGFTKFISSKPDFYVFQLRSWGHFPFITITPYNTSAKQNIYGFSEEETAAFLNEAHSLENREQSVSIRERIVEEKERRLKKAEDVLAAVRAFLASNNDFQTLEHLNMFMKLQGFI